MTKDNKKSEENKIKILVLDDDKTILTAFSCLIQSLPYNYDVEFFGNSQLALQAVTERPGEFKLIMTDIRMPGMDGIAFAEAVRALQPELPIIFMTAYVSEDFSRKAVRFKKAIYLEKPFHLETILRETVPNLLKY